MLRNKKASEILYGVHSVDEALKAGRRDFQEIYTRRKISSRLMPLVEQAERFKIPVRNMSQTEMTLKTGTDLHQGIGALVSPYPLIGLEEMIDYPGPVPGDFFLLLIDGVEDPQNLGALVRTALGVGITGVVIPKNRAASPTPAVSRASAGALEHIRLSRVTNMASTIQTLKKKGVWVVGTDACAASSLFSIDFTPPVAVVIGGEAGGIRPLVRKRCDFLVSIPQGGPVMSLNASVAGAVVMYEVLRQRQTAKNEKD